MPESRTTRTTEQKVAVFRACFSGLQHAYGTYDLTTGRARQVKRPVTDAVLLAHLRGQRPYGVYLLADDQTRAAAVDFDVDDLDPPMRFRNGALNYGLATYIERSKSKGYHVWMFLDEAGVPAAKARLVVRHILGEIGQPNTEVFPKHNRLGTRTVYGNYIYAPLFGALVPHGRTVFLDPGNGFQPHREQWRVLEIVERITQRQLDEIIDLNELTPSRYIGTDHDPAHQPSRVRGSFGLPPCAQRMLADGVTEFQRVSCFRLAVHLKKAGLPQDVAAAALCSWSTRNRPRDGKAIITADEIVEQTASAYAKPYRGCGCEDPPIHAFCDPRCRVHTVSGTATLSAADGLSASERRKTMSDAPPNRPVREFRAGGVRAAIWRNEQRGGEEPRVSHSIRIEKSYRDPRTQNWIQTDCFFAGDLPKLRLVVEKAYEFIVLNEREPDAEPGAATVEHDGAVTH